MAKGKGRHVALLRGINVGGKNKLPMKTLAPLMSELGADDVATYIQSGNVVFSASAAVARRLPAALTEAIAERLGLQVPVLVRSADQWRAVIEGNPFEAEVTDPKTLHVGLLAKAPTPAQVAALDPDRSPPDAFAVQGATIYLHLPRGVAQTKLTNAYLDRTLGTTSTIRNWRTVQVIQAMILT
ncbi:MAG: DUF1697 domain-containing protein [Myxococcales bacterium]|nr:DUF1697 domain-containing protein [Myxococcales bacterium]